MEGLAVGFVEEHGFSRAVKDRQKPGFSPCGWPSAALYGTRAQQSRTADDKTLCKENSPVIPNEVRNPLSRPISTQSLSF
jgi:hypothetical protein